MDKNFTPWVYSPVCGINKTPVVANVYDSSGHIIAIGMPIKQAEFIVRCVNEHSRFIESNPSDVASRTKASITRIINQMAGDREKALETLLAKMLSGEEIVLVESRRFDHDNCKYIYEFKFQPKEAT